MTKTSIPEEEVGIIKYSGDLCCCIVTIETVADVHVNTHTNTRVSKVSTLIGLKVIWFLDFSGLMS